MHDERRVRSHEDPRCDDQIARRGAPSAFGRDRDRVIRHEEPCDLLRRDRQTERDGGPPAVAPDPGDDEGQRIEKVGASTDGERREACRSEQRRQEEGSETGRSSPDDERHRGEEAGHVEVVGVDAERDDRQEEKERERRIGRTPHEFDVRSDAVRPKVPGVIHLLIRGIDHVVREEAAPKRRRAVGADRQPVVAGEQVEIGIGIASRQHQTRRALVQRDRVVVVRGPVIGVLPRHAEDP